jgi:putative radical SAM enzyme (TIGR03279 family)
MKIKSIEIGSIAKELELKSGDDLVAINGNKISDEIDFRFYASEEDVELLINRNGEQLIIEIEKEYDDLLGIQLEEFRTKACGNHCVFCFTDQNPKGMRKSLYFKDEDYRLSFLYGHYTTLTNTSQKDLDRIVTQHLSPLYISVHSTDWEVRKYLFGLKRQDNLLNKIKFLVDHEIQLHTQIVLCPGINDQDQFKKTVFDLANFFPGIESIAVVPLGLTKHREKLEKLQKVTPQDAKNTLDQIQKYQKQFEEEMSSKFIFPSDEFFLCAGQDIPETNYYEGYPQIEDGVGMIRYLLETFAEIKDELPKVVSQKQITFLSGISAYPTLKNEILPTLGKIAGLETRIIPVTNNFLGDSITVSGLLTGQDYAKTITANQVTDTVLIPSKCLNRDNLFLDDWTVEKLEQVSKCSVVLLDDFLVGLPEFLRSLN